MESLTMFVVVRKDLVKLGWPMGALMAQACHACTSSMWQFKDTDRMKEYASDLANMHKVTLEVF
jgi:peptidyl-tRNA hydrolase